MCGTFVHGMLTFAQWNASFLIWYGNAGLYKEYIAVTDQGAFAPFSLHFNNGIERRPCDGGILGKMIILTKQLYVILCLFFYAWEWGQEHDGQAKPISKWARRTGVNWIIIVVAIKYIQVPISIYGCSFEPPFFPEPPHLSLCLLHSPVKVSCLVKKL